MTPDELKAARDALGLTQVGLAAVLGVHKDTYARWEQGRYPVPSWLPTLLILLGLNRTSGDETVGVTAPASEPLPPQPLPD